MGIDLQYTVNPFTPVPTIKDEANIRFDTLGTWAFSRYSLLKEHIGTGLNKLQQSMDRLVEECCDRESVRKTMLKHEEIFKEQVHELHRLYRVQKILMAELSKELNLHSITNATPAANTDTRTGWWSNVSTLQISHSSSVSYRHPFSAQLNSEYNFHQQQFNTRPGLSSQELSICSGETVRIQRGFDLEQPAEVDTTTDVGAIGQAPLCRRQLKDNMSLDCPFLRTGGESDIELTLSIGCSMDKKRLRHLSHSDTELGYSESTSNETRQLILPSHVRPDEEECGESSASFDRAKLQQPPWLFQALTLNRT